MPNWTQEQIRAITERGNLLVSAAAGAGKTAVMTERIVRIIEKGTQVNELLVVTFTKAAASEMKQRIEARLIELADAERDEAARLRLYDAASDIGSASISTIHSFCQDVLRHNPHLAGLDPAFRTADEAEAAMLRAEAMDMIIEAAHEEAENKADPAFDLLLDTIGGDRNLAEFISKIHSFIVARPNPLGWLADAVNAYGDSFDEFANIAGAELVREAKRDLKSMRAEAEKQYRDLLDMGEDGERYLQVIREDIAAIVALEANEEYDRYYFALLDFKPIALPRKKGSTAPEELKEYRKKLKSLMDKLKKRFSMNIDEERNLANRLLPCLKSLYGLTESFMSAYSGLKQDAAVIDFADMEQLSYEVLQNEQAAKEYKEKYKYIFVDEYQDTNSVQNAIIASVSRGDNLFMVGDVKQSIYRFRQAEPANFLDKYRCYDGKMGTRIDLNANFRSRTAILSATNRLFSLIMLGEVGEIDYSDNAALLPGSEQERGYAELALISLESERTGSRLAADQSSSDEALFDDENTEDAQEEFETYERAEAEALYAAERIRELIEGGSVFDKTLGRERRPTYSDFAVLMRAMAGSALTWINTFTRCGIPCTAELGDGYFDAIEVQVFINLLRIIDNRRQDIPLMSVMRSPIGTFNSEELVEIRTGYDGEQLLDRLILASQDIDKSWGKKAKKLLEDIASWREYVRNNGVEALIGKLLNETDYYSYVGILPGGAVRQANLEMLLDRAHIYESSSGRGLHGFIRLLDGMRDNISIGAAQHPAIDAVRIMSIHKSKGLEFPIVFIAGITNRFSKKDKQSAIVMDSELGIGLRPRGFGKKCRDPLFRRAAAAKASAKLAAEEMRILYVGMTRAKERLIIIGSDKSMEKLIKDNARQLTDQRIMMADRYIQWLLGAYFPLGLNLENAEKGIYIGMGSDVLKVWYLRIAGMKRIGSDDAHLSRAEYLDWARRAKQQDTSAFSSSVRYEYPFQEDTLRPAKGSVTDYMEAEYIYSPAVPRFMRGGRSLTAAERGTAVHRLVMNLPLAMHDTESIKAAIGRMECSGKFSEEEARSIYIKSILNLTNSSLWRRMIESPRVERELEFTYLCENGELIQGIIDCCFIDGGGWVIIDYKTTAVHEGESSAAAAARYAPQLEAYARSLESLSGITVLEKWVFLLAFGSAERV